MMILLLFVVVLGGYAILSTILLYVQCCGMASSPRVIEVPIFFFFPMLHRRIDCLKLGDSVLTDVESPK